MKNHLTYSSLLVNQGKRETGDLDKLYALVLASTYTFVYDLSNDLLNAKGMKTEEMLKILCCLKNIFTKNYIFS